MRARLSVPLVVAVLLALPLIATAQGTARGKGGGRATHPKVNAAEACEDCHAQATPEVFGEWRQGTHGINLVKCFVCHGSVGADFRLKPVTDRCIGCHADEVASMRGPAMKGKDCFTCHSAHALNPHVAGAKTTAAARLGADRLAPMVSVEGKIPPAPPAPQGTGGSAAAPTQPGGVSAGAPAPGAPQPPAASPPAAASPAAPGAEKDVKQSQPHPPTDR